MLYGTDGKAEFATPFALNDSNGNWKVQVRDVISGLTAEQIVRDEGARCFT